METRFIQVCMDIDIAWLDKTPRYRVYVNDELFTERTWIWREHYLEEMLQIEAPPGHYRINVELVEPDAGELKVRNMRLQRGHGAMHKNILEVWQ